MTSLIARDASCVWHPYTQSGFGAVPLPVVAARGSSLVLEDGRTILDGISSWWCCLHGHCHPVLVEAARRQFETLDHVLFAGVTHEPAVRLAEALLKVVPHAFDRVFYSDNGSTAVEVAIKLAIQVWRNRGERRTKIVALEGAYHGDTFGAMAVGARSLFSAPFEEHLFSVEFLSPAGSAADLERCETLCASEEVACFIFEPLVQGAGGMRVHAPEVIDRYSSICKRYGVVCIADEVMTGFGRTGTLFASESLAEAPDLVCLSKGLTSGTLPLAVTLCREDIFREFESVDHSKTFFHGHTFTANPIACAVALASLELLLGDESVRDRARIEAFHQDFLRSMRGLRGVLNPQVIGTIFRCDVVTDGERGYRNGISLAAREFFSARGVLLRPLGDVLYFMPPYCFTDEELQRVYSSVVDFVQGVTAR